MPWIYGHSSDLLCVIPASQESLHLYSLHWILLLPHVHRHIYLQKPCDSTSPLAYFHQSTRHRSLKHHLEIYQIRWMKIDSAPPLTKCIGTTSSILSFGHNEDNAFHSLSVIGTISLVCMGSVDIKGLNGRLWSSQITQSWHSLGSSKLSVVLQMEAYKKKVLPFERRFHIIYKCAANSKHVFTTNIIIRLKKRCNRKMATDIR